MLVCLQQTAWGYTPVDTALLMPGPWQNWKTLETEHFRINYQPQHLAFAQRLAAVAETVYQTQTVGLNWQPADKTEVVVNDTYDGSNGGATVLPYNQFFIFMNAPVDGELLDNSPWIQQVFTHEFVHILHMDQSTGGAALLRRVFGRLFFTFPQIFNPTWVTEGIAVYEETDQQKGFGRGQSAFYEAMMRAESLNGFRSFSELSYQGYWGTDWPTGQAYLYGYYFFAFLTDQYGEAKAFEYLQNWNKNLIPWRMQARAREVFGLTAEMLWDQYRAWLQQKFSQQLAQLPAADEQLVVSDGRLNLDPQWLPDGSFYYYREDGVHHPSLQKIAADGTASKVADVLRFNQIDVHPTAGVLLSRQTICDNTNVYTDLYRLDNGRWQRLTQCARFPRAAWSSQGDRIAAVHTDNGLSRIVILDDAGKELQSLPALAAGEVIGYLDWSPDDSQLVAAVRRESSGWNLELLDIEQGQWTALTHNSQLQQRPRFSADGQWVYFLSDRDGVINVRRIHLADGQVQTVSRTRTAIMDFSLNADASKLRLAEYSAHGIVISEQPLAPWGETYSAVTPDLPVVQSLVNQPDFSSAGYTDSSNYSALNTLAPTAWFGMLYADSDNNNWIQLLLQGQDVLGFHQWLLAPAWYLDKQELGGSASYLAWHRLALMVERSYETMQEEDLLVPETWREETRYQAVWQQPFNRFEGTFSFDLGAGQEDISRIMDGYGEYDAYSDNFTGVALNWNDYEYYLHSISPQDGRSIRLVGERYDSFGGGYHSGDLYSLDWREYFSVYGNQVLALRAVAGRADASAKPFQLGNELDELQSLGGVIGFGHTGYTLRGYSDNQSALAGSNLRLVSAEYRLPLLELFDGFTSVPVGLGKTSLSLFADHGAAWSANEDPKYYTGVGIELHPDLLIGYSSFMLNSTLGFAQGLDKDIGESVVYFRLGMDF